MPRPCGEDLPRFGLPGRARGPPSRLARRRASRRPAGGPGGPGVAGQQRRDGLAAAAGELANLSPADLRTVAAGMAKLPARSQWSILMAIRVRGDKSLAPIALAAVRSKDDAVRLAAVRALATVGDVEALPVLTQLAAAEGTLGDAAKQSLEAICGPKIDERIIAAMRAEKDPARRAEWIDLLAIRRPAGVVPVLLSEAAHPDLAVRSRVLDALAKLAGPKDIPAMVTLVLKAEKGPERDEAEKAVRLVCQQSPRPNTGPTR